MIKVVYSENGQTVSKEFPDSRKGNRESLKFLQGLRESRINHPWYYKLTKIESLKLRLKYCRSGSGSKTRIQFEVELKQEEQDRNELLEMCDVSGPPRC
jgi:hypothetical protein